MTYPLTLLNKISLDSLDSRFLLTYGNVQKLAHATSIMTTIVSHGQRLQTTCRSRVLCSGQLNLSRSSANKPYITSNIWKNLSFAAEENTSRPRHSVLSDTRFVLDILASEVKRRGDATKPSDFECHAVRCSVHFIHVVI
jgi:hypothetical protein